jgi:hypothetical protein
VPRDVHRRGTILLSTSLLLIGLAIIVRTIEGGGSPISVGILLGILFMITGAGRLWIATRGPR